MTCRISPAQLTIFNLVTPLMSRNHEIPHYRVFSDYVVCSLCTNITLSSALSVRNHLSRSQNKNKKSITNYRLQQCLLTQIEGAVCCCVKLDTILDVVAGISIRTPEVFQSSDYTRVSRIDIRNRLYGMSRHTHSTTRARVRADVVLVQI